MSQDTKIATLVTGVCCNNKEIASKLHTLADEISNGEWGSIEIACLVMDSDAGILRQTLGRAGVNKRDVVGLLTWCVSKMTHD